MASLQLGVGARVLGNGEVTIQSSSSVTNTLTNYRVALSLPLSLGIPYTLELFMPFRNVSVPSINNNLLSSTYNTSTSMLTVSNVGSAALLITGFLTSVSTAPVTLSGSLFFNGTLYFYFVGYDVAMDTPSDIVTFNFSQSNAVVGRIFTGTFTISDLLSNDIIRVPSQYYALDQGNCSNNAVCLSNASVRVTSANLSGPTVLTFNLVNNGFLSVSTFNLSVFDPSGVFIKQTRTMSINTQTMNVINITGSQTDPYFLVNSTYTF